MKYYTIYKTTNLINNKIYIGKHITSNIDDGYLGSGKILLKAIKKHGINNFEKEILFILSSKEEMNQKELEIVDEEFLSRSDTYNLKIGGDGGFDYINNNSLGVRDTEFYKKMSKKGEKKRQLGYQNFLNDTNRAKKAHNKSRETLKKKYKDGIMKNPMLGKNHSDKTKNIISKKAKLNQQGENNSFFGKQHSESSKDLIRQKLKNRPLFKCPYCNISCIEGLFNRWHNHNCNKNPNSKRYVKDITINKKKRDNSYNEKIKQNKINEVINYAKTLKSYEEFKQNKKMYNQAKRRKLLSKIKLEIFNLKESIIFPKNKEDLLDFLTQDASRFSSYSEYRRDSLDCYKKALNSKLLHIIKDRVFGLSEIKYNKWTSELVMIEAKKCSSWREFYKNNSLYHAALSRDLIADIKLLLIKKKS